MNNLYDIGYIGCKMDHFQKVVELTGATIIDIRFSPFSRNPVWIKSKMQKVLGKHYVHNQSLGNVNYKIPGMENVKFLDEKNGLKTIESYLKTGPVIVMCACKDRNHCHRLLAVQKYEAITGVKSIPLDPSSLKELAGIKEDKQLLMML